MKKNKRIEVSRGILILMILFFHYTYRFSEIYNINTINFFSLDSWGTVGVGCFFIITGFFIVPSVIEKFKLKNYILKKLLRIYPAYLFCMTLTFISVKIWGLEGRETNFIDYLLNVVMLNGFINVNYVDGAHWYLTYLIIFYIIIGIFVKYIKNSKKYLVVWLIIKDAIKVITFFFHNLNPIYMIIGGNYVEFIIIGISLKEILKDYNVKHNLKKSIKDKYIYYCLIAISLLQISVLFNFDILIGIILFIGIFIFWGVKQNDKKEISNFNILYFIGCISYIIYLIHQNVGYQILLNIFNRYGSISVLAIIFVSIFMICISITVEYCFERPIQKLIKNKIRIDRY